MIGKWGETRTTSRISVLYDFGQRTLLIVTIYCSIITYPNSRIGWPMFSKSERWDSIKLHSYFFLEKLALTIQKAAAQFVKLVRFKYDKRKNLLTPNADLFSGIDNKPQRSGSRSCSVSVVRWTIVCLFHRYTGSWKWITIIDKMTICVIISWWIYKKFNEKRKPDTVQYERVN